MLGEKGDQKSGNDVRVFPSPKSSAQPQVSKAFGPVSQVGNHPAVKRWLSMQDTYDGGVKISSPKQQPVGHYQIYWWQLHGFLHCSSAQVGVVLTTGIDLGWPLVHTYSHTRGRCSTLRQNREIFLMTALQSSSSLLLPHSMGSPLVQDDCACVYVGGGVLIMHTCILPFFLGLSPFMPLYPVNVTSPSAGAGLYSGVYPVWRTGSGTKERNLMSP